MKKFIFGVFTFMICFSAPLYPANIEEGGEYVYISQHSNGSYLAWKATVDRYSGGSNAKVQLIEPTKSGIFTATSGSRNQGTKWVSVSSLMTCSEAKNFFISQYGENFQNSRYQWGAICN